MFLFSGGYNRPTHSCELRPNPKFCAGLWARPRGQARGMGQLAQAGICLELGRHILKMLECDPRRPTLSAIVFLGL
jgi:hypothetical protein